ncbi:MAG: cytochrome b N-terminal domain-containing protein [Armatimonadota bacterium]|nr:cytochrome b N-terminal domain-containing protein [Armatimonadota bacterium]MDR7451330.1 cytochrome b N-terminal domain-containing protein [Armatimonadota bacterium]MDR7466766.1 cytochrome b N-terminal domain-containing protein [Armatimonadota bacterium]MDR7492760.1 cytochrome b N-terminal domain-containing protein [Armatimonadota bacterium]MDR7498536.1 cytochrome b N-terminal domain-containing protein [Armatimonadota bacterium]
MTTRIEPWQTEQPDARQRAGAWRALDERLGLSELTYPVPRHANTLAYSLGGISLIGFIVLIISGILLAQYYSPMPQFANDSVRAMMQGMGLQRFVRGIHYWAAQVVMLAVVLHLLRVFFTASFKKPREANWVIGVGLLATTIGLFFTGTVLKWDQEGFEALEHNVAIGELLGGLGHWFAHAFAQNVPILVRLYIAHVSILPGILILLLAAHFWLIRRHGISARPGRPVGEYLPFSSHLKHLGKYALVLVGVVLALAVLLPPIVGPAPVEGIEVTKPPWPFLPLFAFENWIGVPGLFWVSVVAFALLLLVPFVDRSPEVLPARRRLAIAVAVVIVLALVGFGLLAYLTPGAEHVGGVLRAFA